MTNEILPYDKDYAASMNKRKLAANALVVLAITVPGCTPIEPVAESKWQPTITHIIYDGDPNGARHKTPHPRAAHALPLGIKLPVIN